MEIEAIGPNELRAFINALRDSHKYRCHPYVKPQRDKLSDTRINTHALAPWDASDDATFQFPYSNTDAAMQHLTKAIRE